MTGVSKRTVLTSLAWKFLERGSSQVVAFVVSLVLARILGPSDYGTVSLVLVFTSISLVFVQGGFNTALVQRKSPTELDYSSALAFSLGMAAAIYALLFFTSPLIAKFYGDQTVGDVLRVLALILIPGAYNSVQVAYATRNFLFRKLFVANLVSALSSGTVGIAMAFAGAGIWALVAQQLGNQVFVCVALFVGIRWKPKAGFSAASVCELFGFGGNVLAGNLLVQLFLNLRSLIVGKLYDTVTLGLFNRGRQFSTAVMEAVTGSMQEVMLPTFSKAQESPEAVLAIVRASVRSSCFIIFPLMFGLAATAHSLVGVLLGESWIGCVPFLQLFALSYCFQPIQIISAQAMRGLGDSRTTLRLEFVRKAAELALMFASIPFGAVALAASSVFAGAVSCAVALRPNVRVLGYRMGDQLSDLAHPLIGSLIMLACVLMARVIGLSDAITLLLQIAAGVISYSVVQLVLRDETMGAILKRLAGAKRK